MAQFEYPKYRNPCVSSTFEWIPFLISSPSLSVVIRNWTPQYKDQESRKFSTFLPFILGRSNYLLPQREEERKGQGQKIRKGIHSKVDETQGFLYLGLSNWTICSLWNWLCSKKCPPFYFSYWEVQFLITPERGRKEGAGAENGKRNSLEYDRKGVLALRPQP